MIRISMRVWYVMTKENGSDLSESGRDDPGTRRRREILTTLGAAGIAGIAGCGGGSDGGDGGDGEGGDGGDGDGVQMIDRTYRANITDQNINNAEFNFVRSGADFVVGPIWLFEWALVANMKTAEFAGQLLSDWSVDGTTMSLEMDDRFSWHNGDPVNADDMVTQMRIASLFGSARRVGNADGVIKNPASIQKTGDYSLEIEMPAELNPKLAVGQLFASGGPKNVLLWTKTSKFGSFEERLRDGTTDDEKQSIQSDLTNTSWGIDEFVGNGPFQVSDYTSSALLLERYDGHPQADNINFPQIEYKPRGGQGGVAALKNRGIEQGGGVLSQDEIDQVPDIYRQVGLLRFGGTAVICNHQHEIFGRTNVKQALAHITDNQEVVDNFGTTKADPADPTDAGIAPQNKDPYLGGAIEGNLITYDSPETAVSLLEEEGFTREDGEWYKPDGDRWSFQLKTFDNPVWNPQARTIASQWSDFGIDCEAQIVEGSTFFSEYPNGSYDIVVEYGRGAGSQNPYFAHRRNMIGFGGSSMQYPEEVEAPPVGERDGSLQTYVISDLLNNALTAPDQDTFVEAIRELAWVSNYTLPVQQLTHLKFQFMYNTDTFEWPPADSNKYSWAFPRGQERYMARRGWMSAKPT